VVLTVRDQNSGKLHELFSTADSNLGQAMVQLSELEHSLQHRYTVPLDAGPMASAQGELSFSASFAPFAVDELSMKAAYVATGRAVPV